MAIFGALADALPFPAEEPQKAAWRFTIDHVQTLAEALPEAWFGLEFAIPRMGRRADAVIVHGGTVFVLEYKVGETGFSQSAREQVHGYALDLKHFHQTSAAVGIVPVLIATRAAPQDVPLGLWAADRVHSPVVAAPGDVGWTIERMASGEPLDADAWAAGTYRPTPTIIEAASALFRGHDVAEISRNEAGAENLSRTSDAIEAVVTKARAERAKALIFVTGVPGAGKTLAGLNIACGRLSAAAGRDATFLSGNGPLVEVLSKSLKDDVRRRRKPVPGDPEAKFVLAKSADKFVMAVHRFRDEYARDPGPPSENVVVFDEAQRAWNAQKCGDFMRRKKGAEDWVQSEPEFLLSVMDRRGDWCSVICLVGEGQEIHTGEAGIGAWVSALAGLPNWRVAAPPHLLARSSNLERQERAYLETRATLDAALHLGVPVRSFRSERVSAWVAAVLSNDAAAAHDMLPDPAAFPIVRTRSLEVARAWLRQQRRGNERTGLLAASDALRLRPEGLHVKARPDVCSWFLNPTTDVRSSNALEEVGTEFDVQGLELDWCGVGWDLTLRRGPAGWEAWQFWGADWRRVRDAEARTYALNAMRVLLTRARQGMILFVPRGDPNDPTRPPALYNVIDTWLAACGVPSADAA